MYLYFRLRIRHTGAWTVCALCLALSAGCAHEVRETVAARPRSPASADAPRSAPGVPSPPAEPHAAPAALALHTEVLGQSAQGTPLKLELFGDGPDTVFIFGGIHGNEAASAALAHNLAAWLRENPDLWTGRTIAVLPEANPDGLRAGTRQNAAGVDLNRNFPARNWRPPKRRSAHGAQPGTEPETLALMHAVETLRPSRILALHVMSNGGSCNNYDGPAANLARQMTGSNGYPVRANIGYPTPGSLGSWAGVDRGIPTITLELPAGASATEIWRANRDALLAFIRG